MVVYSWAMWVLNAMLGIWQQCEAVENNALIFSGFFFRAI